MYAGKTHRLIARLSRSQNKSAAISVLLQPNSLKFDQNIGAWMICDKKCFAFDVFKKRHFYNGLFLLFVVECLMFMEATEV